MARIRSKFMFNHRIKHPTIVFEDLGKYYGYIGITHSKRYKGTKNIPLPVNPEYGNKTQAYILPNPRKDKKNAFTPEKKKMRINRKNSYWINKVKNSSFK